MNRRILTAACVVALLVPVASAAGANTHPLAVSPTSGPPGATIAFSGSECPDPFGEVVSLYLNPDQSAESWLLATPTPAIDGTFDGSFVIPTGGPKGDPGGFVAPGTYPVISDCGRASFGGAELTVQPYPSIPAGVQTGLDISPAVVPAGEDFFVQGPGTDNEGDQAGGFTAEQEVVFVLYPGARILATTTTLGKNVAGTASQGLEGALVVPIDVAPGDYTIVAYGRPQFPGMTPILVNATAMKGALTITEREDASPGDDSDGGDSGSGGSETGAFTPPAAPPEADGPLVTTTTVASPGGTVGISGAGFVPGEDVPIVFYSDPVLLTTVQADEDGAIAVEVTIPDDAEPGEHTLVAFGSDQVLAITITVQGTAPPATPVQAQPTFTG